MSNQNSDNINSHYGQTDMAESILEALKKAGKNLDNLTREDIAGFEEFHIGGREATQSLAEFVQIRNGSKVLDIGCGIGGPARTLATEYDCQVTGVDLTEEYIKTAQMLTKLFGMEKSVHFQQGDATNLEFDSPVFDYVWLQHVTMNIGNKNKLFTEAFRLLKPFGQLVFYEILMLNNEPLTYPVFWAETEELNYLINEDHYRASITKAGFVEVQWEDRTIFAIEWFEKMLAKMKEDGPPQLGLNVIAPKDTPLKAANVLKNLKDQKICVVRAAYTKKS
jgi:SAM-dependent methyltransferase